MFNSLNLRQLDERFARTGGAKTRGGSTPFLLLCQDVLALFAKILPDRVTGNLLLFQPWRFCHEETSPRETNLNYYSLISERPDFGLVTLRRVTKITKQTVNDSTFFVPLQIPQELHQRYLITPTLAQRSFFRYFALRQCLRFHFKIDLRINDSRSDLDVTKPVADCIYVDSGT